MGRIRGHDTYSRQFQLLSEGNSGRGFASGGATCDLARRTTEIIFRLHLQQLLQIRNPIEEWPHGNQDVVEAGKARPDAASKS